MVCYAIGVKERSIFMINKSLKIIVATILMVVAGWGYSSYTPVYAGTDVEASGYGFIVDDEYYRTSYWYNTVTSNVKCDGNIIGTNCIDIGMTRTKSTLTGGTYFDQVMIRCSMKGKNPKSGYCGYSEHLTVESKVPNGTTLVAYSPESEAGMTSYDVGCAVDTDGTVGLSATTTVTKKALEVNSYSNGGSGKFKVCYDYIHHLARWNWDVYGKYAYEESRQRSHFTVKTTKSRYKMELVVTSKFERWSIKPSFWAVPSNQYATLIHTITFTTPY